MPEPEADLFRVAAQFRRSLLASERAAAVTMTRAYADSWLRVKRDLSVLQADIAELRKAGQKVPPSWLFRAQRLPSLQRQIETELRAFADLANGTITAQQQQAVDAALSQSRQLAMTALGQPPPGAVVRWDTLPRGALTDLVGFQQDGSPLRALLDELGPNVSAGVRKELITGVAVGKNPREIARAIRKAYGMGLNRALTISRTETLRAYREASRESYQANSDVVKGWIWHSALGPRTCIMCHAMHGSKHKLTERLDDHPRGRCAALPLVATWEELLGPAGKGIPDNQPQVTPGPELFKRLTEAEQRTILGSRAAFEAYKAGAVQLEDFVGRKRSQRWGSMRYARSLDAILGKEEARRWKRATLRRLQADDVGLAAG